MNLLQHVDPKTGRRRRVFWLLLTEGRRLQVDQEEAGCILARSSLRNGKFQMEVKVQLGGVEATIVVANAQEAADVLRSIAGLTTLADSKSSRATEISVANEDGVKITTQGLDARTFKDRLNDALKLLKGSLAANVLLVLSKNDEFTHDEDIRASVGLREDQNLGPLFANISKAVKGQGLDNSEVIKRYSIRPSKGETKFNYYFALTPAAQVVIRAFKDLGEPVKAPPRLNISKSPKTLPQD